MDGDDAMTKIVLDDAAWSQQLDAIANRSEICDSIGPRAWILRAAVGRQAESLQGRQVAAIARKNLSVISRRSRRPDRSPSSGTTCGRSIPTNSNELLRCLDGHAHDRLGANLDGGRQISAVMLRLRTKSIDRLRDDPFGETPKFVGDEHTLIVEPLAVDFDV